jgi:hypothetical protein
LIYAKYKEKFEETKGIIRSANLKKISGNTVTKRKRTKGQTMICKILHRKLKIEQHKPHSKKGGID